MSMTEPVRGGAAADSVGQRHPKAWNQWRHAPDPAISAFLERELYFEGERRHAGLNRYFTLLVLAVLIATLGLYADSAAILIAAMLVAPLMMPIVGLAFALVTGQPGRQLSSALLVLASIGVTIGIAYLMGRVLPDLGVLQSEVLVRTRPQLIDLGIALVAGAGGAYAMVRREAIASLAGVAIGVSLVIPLAAAGLLLEAGELVLTEGALLMFVTNLAAVVFASALVFSVTGFLPVSEIGHLPRRIKVGIITALLAVLAVAVPLYIISHDVLQATREQHEVKEIVDRWLAETDFELLDMQLVGDELRITVLASAESPMGLQTLEAELDAVTGDHLTPVLRVIQYQLVQPDDDQP